jgi:hypothetical protein
MPAPAPAPTPPAPVPTPPPAPARVTIKLDSDPIGADVYRMPQGVRIGTTPLVYPMDAIDGEMVLIVKKRGFTDLQLAVPADKDSAQTVKLASAASRPHGKGSGSQTQTNVTPPPNGGTLDPFEKLDPKKPGGR